MVASHWLAEKCAETSCFSLARGTRLRSLLHDLHCLLVLLLAGPQGGKSLPLIGWWRNVLLLIGQRNTIYVPCSMTGPQGSKFLPLIGWWRNAQMSLAAHWPEEIYVPCSMTVTVSWFSFWLDHKAVSSRLSLAGAEMSCFSLARGTQFTRPDP